MPLLGSQVHQEPSYPNHIPFPHPFQILRHLGGGWNHMHVGTRSNNLFKGQRRRVAPPIEIPSIGLGDRQSYQYVFVGHTLPSQGQIHGRQAILQGITSVTLDTQHPRMHGELCYGEHFYLILTLAHCEARSIRGLLLRFLRHDHSWAPMRRNRPQARLHTGYQGHQEDRGNQKPGCGSANHAPAPLQEVGEERQDLSSGPNRTKNRQHQVSASHRQNMLAVPE